MVSFKGKYMEQDKVRAVEDWLTFNDAFEVCSFLGLAGYYCHFVWQFAYIVASFINLLKKRSSFEWKLEQQSTFDRLKEALTTTPIFQSYNLNLLYMLDIDAFDFAIRMVFQQDFGRSLQPMVYKSYKLRRIEHNYSA